jgi:hypothetical protein
MSQPSSATTVAAPEPDPSSTETTLPAFAALGDLDTVGQHYALVYIAYQASRTSSAAA